MIQVAPGDCTVSKDRSGPEIHQDGIKSDKDLPVNNSSSHPHTQDFNDGHVSVLLQVIVLSPYLHHPI